MKKICYTIFLTLSFLVQAQGIDTSLYSFDFKMDNLTIVERAALFAELGYSGTTFAVKTDSEREKLQAYLNTKEFTSGKLSIPIVYFHHSFDPDSEVEDELLQKTLELLPNGTDLWVILGEEHASEEKALVVLKRMSQQAQKLSKNIVIYPHDDTFIESVEGALPYIEKLNLSNLFLTMHLCHELRHGNGDRLLDVAIKAKPYLKFASISGSDVTMKFKFKGDWSDAIQPLDQGDYDVSQFVSVLQKIKFKGKMVLHTFGIEDEPRDHLKRSMAKWKEMVQTTYKTQNNDLNHILDTPENAYWDETSKSWFISNLGGEKVTIAKDGYGWITRLDENGTIVENRWVEGLDAPTGMASYDGFLYVADRGVLVKINIESGKIIKKIELPGARFPNDVAAASNGDIYVSDTYENIIYKINKKGKPEVFLKTDKLECPNGLWVDGKDLVVATWGPMTNEATFETSRKGTLLKINRKSKEITPIGAGRPIANFDGVIKYKDFYYATDWTGGRLLKISSKGNVEEVITGFVQLADLGVNVNKGILMIPEMSKNRYIMVHLKDL